MLKTRKATSLSWMTETDNQLLCCRDTVLAINIQIEFAKLADVPEISRLSRDEIEFGLGWNYTPQKIVRIIKNKSKNIVVASHENQFVGFGAMTYRKDQANLDLLAVHNDYRQNKVGTKLVLWLEKVAATTGAFNIFVQLRENNTGAFNFYEHLGYQQLDELAGFYRGIENGIVMAKSIRPMINAT